MLIIYHSKILEFLTTQEIAELYLINKGQNAFLCEIKAIKSSIWRGDLPEALRAKFWIYQCPIYK
jgi:hypothetical protein